MRRFQLVTCHTFTPKKSPTSLWLAFNLNHIETAVEGSGMIYWFSLESVGTILTIVALASQLISIIAGHS